MLGDHADGQLELGVRSAGQVLHVEIAVAEIGGHVGLERLEIRRLHRLIDVAPVNVRLGRRVADNELVAGRTPGVRPRRTGERPVARQLAFTTRQGRFVELRWREVPPESRAVEAAGGEDISGVNRALHRSTPQTHDYYKKSA